VTAPPNADPGDEGVTLVGYTDSCSQYGNRACSETAHQMQLVQTPNEPARWYRPGIGATTVRSAVAIPGSVYDATTFQMVSALADRGLGVVLAMSVDADFSRARTDGVLVDTGAENDGGHAVQMIRYVRDRTAWGGGWVVIRNSWGCWGDNGYAYLPLGWARRHVRTIDVIDAASMVDNTPPEVTIRTPSNPPNSRTQIPFDEKGTSTLLELEARVDDATPGPNCCDVTWYSTEDGYLGTGNPITAVLHGPGVRGIRAVARDSYGAIGESEPVEVDVFIQTPPIVAITRPLDLLVPGFGSTMRAPVGAVLPLHGTARDTNVDFYEIPCEDHRWWFGPYGDAPFVRDCSTVFEATAPQTRRLTFSATGSFDEVSQTGIWVVFKEWEPEDEPWVAIYELASGRVFLDTPNEHYRFRARAVSGLEDAPTIQWFLINKLTNQQIRLGTGEELYYDLPYVPSSSGWEPLTYRGPMAAEGGLLVVVEVEDANGLAFDEVSLSYYVPPN